RAELVLDGDTGVDTVLIQQVDGCHFQSLQHRVDNLANVLGPAVDAVARAVRIDPESELRCNHDMLAERRQRLADEFFVRERTVDFSRVEQRHAASDRGVDERDGLLPVGGGTVGPVSPMQPYPIADTCNPLLPSVRFFMLVSVATRCACGWWVKNSHGDVSTMHQCSSTT